MNRELIHRSPENHGDYAPLLFIHGAWHGAWGWDVHFMPYFAAQGFDCYALSLYGHGKTEGNVRWARVGQYVEDVEWAVEQIRAKTGQQPVIIGHSMGGYVTQKFLETHSAPAAVLVATIPVTGTLPFFIRYMLRHPLTFFRSLLTADTYPIIGTPELLHDTFFSEDFPRTEVERYHPLMQRESFAIVFQSALLALPRPGRIKTPVFVIAAENDRVFSVAEEKRTAAAYHTEAVIMPDIAHDILLEAKWQDSADRIIAWLHEKLPRLSG